jgi:uncharacterized membrane protein YkoI
LIDLSSATPEIQALVNEGDKVDRKRLIIGAAVTALALGGGGAALATQQAQEEEQDIKGAVSAPTGSGEENEAAETEEPRGLAELTRIDQTVAEEAALGVVPGAVREVELENENGFVVYEVEVAGQDGALHEVVVDAGNGEVLGQELEEEEAP